MPRLPKSKSVSASPTPSNKSAPASPTSLSEESSKDETRKDETITLGVVRELLLVQERMFKTFIDSLSVNLTARIDNLVSQVSDLKSSLEFSQKDIGDHEATLTSLNRSIQETSTEIDNVQSSITTQLSKLTYLENQSRRSNLRIDGIPEEPNETWDSTENKVKQILVEKLQLVNTPRIERSHRISSRNMKPGKPKTVMCKLYDWKEKELILKQARKIKPEGIYITEDLAEDTIKRRKEQLPNLIEARNQGKIAYFVLDRLIIKNRPLTHSPASNSPDSGPS